jgi:hypothetical protein
MGEERKVYRILVAKPKGTRPLGRPRRRWDNDIRLDLKETGCRRGGVNSVGRDRDLWGLL